MTTIHRKILNLISTYLKLEITTETHGYMRPSYLQSVRLLTYEAGLNHYVAWQCNLYCTLGKLPRASARCIISRNT